MVPHSYRCARCGGNGYLMRIHDKAMVKCDGCEGSGTTQRTKNDIGAEIKAALERHDGPNMPEGWKLVPIKPTDAMIEAQFKCWHDENGGKEAYVAQMYTAMVEACPPFATSHPTTKEQA